MQDKARGMILGLAVGDALGSATEFLTYEKIRERYGPDGIKTYNRVPALFTDDTQMSIAVAEALIEAGSQPLEALMAAVNRKFLDWLRSPDNCRAPGLTTIKALRDLEGGRPWRETGNPLSKGCGSVMRTAPVGYYYRDDPLRLRETAHAIGIVTHSHPAAVAACLAASEAVRLALMEAPTASWPERLRETTRGISPELDSVLARLASAAALPDTQAAVAAVCPAHGGWTAEEVLGTALLAVLRHPGDFRASILLSVNTGGDSDSIGCVAGAIQGARLGAGAIPPEWVSGVERREDLEILADRLCDHGHGNPSPERGSKQ